MKLYVEDGSHKLDILVENLGRSSLGHSLDDYDQRKGLLNGSVYIDEEPLTGLWTIMTLDFKPSWVTRFVNALCIYFHFLIMY